MPASEHDLSCGATDIDVECLMSISGTRLYVLFIVIT